MAKAKKVKWDSLVSSVSRLVVLTNRTEAQAIKNRLALGNILLEVLVSAAHGENVVVNLAETLTTKLGYKIFPQRLWECARAAQRFRSLDEIFKAAGTRDVNWSTVLGLCKGKRDSKITIQIVLTEDDYDIIRYKALPCKTRNEFLKESLRLGIKTIERTNKLPDLSKTPAVMVFAKKAFKKAA